MTPTLRSVCIERPIMHTQSKLTTEDFNRRYPVKSQAMKHAIMREMIYGDDAIKCAEHLIRTTNAMMRRRDPLAARALAATKYIAEVIEIMHDSILDRYDLAGDTYPSPYLPALVVPDSMRDAPPVEIEEDSNLTYKEFFGTYGGDTSNFERLINRAIRAEMLNGDALLDSIGIVSKMRKAYYERGFREQERLCDLALGELAEIIEVLRSKIIKIYNLEDRREKR